MAIFVWLLWGALGASAHDLYPIRPVYATVRVEPDRVVAELRADSIFWIEEVAGLHPMPPRDWPAETLAKVAAYANSHFRLTSGGKALSGRLVDARYRQLPWEVNEEGTFFLRLEYPAAAPGAELAGSANFYEEYRKEVEEELKLKPVPFADGYRTILDIPGRRRMSFTLTPDAPSFAASHDEARRTPFSMALESFSAGAGAAFGTAAGFPLILALVLCLMTERPDRAGVAGIAAASAAGFFAAAHHPIPGASWAATIVAALAAGRGSWSYLASFPAAAGLAFAWGSAALPALPHSALAWPAAFAGATGAGSALLAVVWFGARAEYRRLSELSESRVEELFARRTRLTATVLVMIGAYGLWQSFQR